MTTQHLTTFLDELLEKLTDDWRPEDLELAKRVARDIADLTLRGIAGDEVEAELEAAAVTANAITAAAGLSLASVIREGVLDFVGRLLRRFVSW